MSSGHFARTTRNTPQRNLNKSQQPTQASFTPSQASSIIPQQTNKGGYVYKPPTKIVRTNVNAAKQTKIQQKIQSKKQQASKVIQQKIQQPVKPATFARKPAYQTTKQTIVKTTTVVTEVTEVIEQVKPVISKPYSRLNNNRNNDPLANLGIIPPKKQEAPKVQQKPKPNLPYYRSKPTKQVTPVASKNPLQQLITDNTNAKSLPTLDLKKPTPYTYPKKITKRQTPAVEQKLQIKIQNNVQQIKPQTPKFNRQPAQQTPQPPIVSSYTYQRKNVNQNLATQSAANLKANPYQSTILAPVQKTTQPLKSPVSAILQSSPSQTTKSPLSHMSRYGSKVQTPAKTPKQQKQQIQTQQKQVQKPLVKRSNLIVYLLHRLYMQKLKLYFAQLNEYIKNIKETKQNEKLHQQFERSVNNFSRNYEKNVLMRNSFNLIKSIFAKIVKNDMIKSTDPKLSNQLINNRNTCIGRLIDNLNNSDNNLVKYSFGKLKSLLSQNKIRQTKIQIGAKILTGLQIKKLKEYWKSIIQWNQIKYQIQSFKLTRISQINLTYRKYLLNRAFIKLNIYKLKQMVAQIKPLSKIQSKSVISKVQEKSVIQTGESETNKYLKQKIFDLQTKLSEAQKKSSEVPKQSDLRKTIQQLKQQKQQVSAQISVKKQRIAELKQKIDLLISKGLGQNQELSSLNQTKPQNEEQTLSLIHQIYMKLYKQSEQECISQGNIESLYSIHRVEQNKETRETVQKWLAIQQNVSLKHWINLFQGNYVNDSSGSSLMANRKEAYKQLEEENQIVKKFIRSYIKQRYMWEEVKQYVAAVISQ